MRILLMHPSEDFDPSRPPPAQADALVDDLGLATLFDAMAGRDKFLHGVARAAVLSPLVEPGPIVYRQEVLADCLAHPGFTKELYALASDALEAHRRLTFWGLNRSPESLRYSSVQALEVLFGYLVRLRRLVDDHGAETASPAFARLRSMLLGELDDAYMTSLQAHLNELKLPRGLIMSAQLGRAGHGTGYVLHKAAARGVKERLARRGQAACSFSVPDRDDNGLRALADLQARGVSIVANVLAQSVDHVVGLFASLRTELAFYIGCLNLHAALSTMGAPLCTPVPLPAGGPPPGTRPVLQARQLYDPCLSLATDHPAVGSDIDAGAKTLVLITGANRGGKSTFLRSTGLAYLMMQCGMFVAARSFTADVCRSVFTHFKRNEDTSMTGGKLDEELSRMSTIVSQLSPGCLLLCNEPFASTNEREGSDIGRQVFIPLANAGVKVFVVTHLFDLAESIHEKGAAGALFLRAPRQAGDHPFRLVEGAPEPTAYGEDVYKRIFGEPPSAPTVGDQALGTNRWAPGTTRQAHKLGPP